MIPISRREIVLCILLSIACVTVSLGLLNAVGEPVINDANVSPELDVALFTPYQIIADIELATDANVTLTGLNGDGGTTIDYYSDGNTATTSRTFALVNTAGNTWEYNYAYPDYIYPEIYFAPSTITWVNSPDDYALWKESYHIFHYANNYTMEANMSFWIEFYVEEKSTTNSVIQVFLVGNSNTINYFSGDWRDSSDTTQLGTINKNMSYHHEHSANSSHYLIGLSPDASGLVNGVDVSTDFWVILYCNANTEERGWNLKYHSASLQDNTNRWYLGDGTTWDLPTALHGAPDTHIHIARRGTSLDGVTAFISATNLSGDSNKSYVFYFNTPSNLAPSGVYFDVPENTTYDGVINIDWTDATDPNGDTLTYTLVLVYPGGGTETLYSDTSTAYDFETGGYTDGVYDLQVVVSDGTTTTTSVLSNQYGEGFTISHTGGGYVGDDDVDDGGDGWTPDDYDDEEEWIFGDDHDGDGDYDRDDFRSDVVVLIDIFGGLELGDEPDDVDIDFIVDILIDLFHCDDMWYDGEIDEIPIIGGTIDGVFDGIEDVIHIDISYPFDFIYQALMHENTVNFYQFGHWKLRAWMYAIFFGFIFFIIFGKRDKKKEKNRKSFVVGVAKNIKSRKTKIIKRKW